MGNTIFRLASEAHPDLTDQNHDLHVIEVLQQYTATYHVVYRRRDTVVRSPIFNKQRSATL